MKKRKDQINVNMGIRFRQLREDSGYTSAYIFADDCGINEAYYGRLERGEYSPTLKMLSIIAKQLGITISELVKNIDIK